jgi:hypothetical protein
LKEDFPGPLEIAFLLIGMYFGLEIEVAKFGIRKSVTHAGFLLTAFVSFISSFA